MADRLLFYNSVLDQSVDSKAKEWPGDVTPADDATANLVGSICDDGLHRPAIDIDMPCRLVPSTTEGHFHLYIDGVALSWEGYLRLLKALVGAGIVEARYVEHARERGMTLLRREGVKKPNGGPAV